MGMLGRSMPGRGLLARSMLGRRGLAFMPTQMESGGLLAVAKPFRPVAPRTDGPFALRAVPPLLQAILKLGVSESPHRIIAYETESGEQFNAAYFDDEAAFAAYRAWFLAEAVQRGGQLHAAWAERFLDAAELPTSKDWLWGVGHSVLSDTRVGEYQLGHGHRYSRMMFRDAAAKADAEAAAVDPQFEARISDIMEQEGVVYYGRLVMSAQEGHGGWFTKSRYGSLLDAERGTWLIKELLFKQEMARWFSSYETVTGRIASTHLVTPKYAAPHVPRWLSEMTVIR